MKILALASDTGGCFEITLSRPHNELKSLGVETEYSFTLPSSEVAPGTDVYVTANMFSRYDLIVAQRITSLGLMKFVKNACHLANKPLIYINDDDYLHLERHNPCFFSTAMDGLVQTHRDLMAAGKIDEANALLPVLDEQRKLGREEFKELLSLPDGIVTTTEELKQVFAPYNRNILVSPNCVTQVHYERDYVAEEYYPPGSIGQDPKGNWIDVSGHLKVDNRFGLASIPAFWYGRRVNEKGEEVVDPKPNRIVRVGYSGTVSHQDDWKTIHEYWCRLVEKYNKKVWFTYIGDPFFAEQATGGRDRRHYIKESGINTYEANIRNLDIAIAPLRPTPFNMSKSDIKAVEAASWGCALVLPKYITYTRSFVHGETALFYSNGREFQECMEQVFNNNRLRTKLANNGRNYIANYRLQKFFNQPRYDFYEAAIINTPQLIRVFT